MSIADKGGGKYEITLAGPNPRNIKSINLTLGPNSVGQFVPYIDDLPGGIPTSSPDIQNGAPIYWLTNIKFRGNITPGNIPSFTLVLPNISGSIYAFYNEDNQKLSALDNRKKVAGDTIIYQLDTNDPTVGMT